MKKKFPISTDAREYLEALLEEAGMSIVPPEIREEMLIELARKLDAKLTLAALSSMPDEKVRVFADLLASKEHVSKVTSFINKNVPNVEKIYAQALVEFRTAYMARTMQAGSQVVIAQ